MFSEFSGFLSDVRLAGALQSRDTSIECRDELVEIGENLTALTGGLGLHYGHRLSFQRDRAICKCSGCHTSPQSAQRRYDDGDTLFAVVTIFTEPQNGHFGCNVIFESGMMNQPGDWEAAHRVTADPLW